MENCNNCRESMNNKKKEIIKNQCYKKQMKKSDALINELKSNKQINIQKLNKI